MSNDVKIEPCWCDATKPSTYESCRRARIDRAKKQQMTEQQTAEVRYEARP